MPDVVREEVLDKREAILHAARELFAGYGYDNVTIAEIARVAGVAAGTVYLYFENKHDLLLEICLSLNAAIAQVIVSPEILALPIRQVPRAVIEETFRSSRKHIRLMQFYQIEAESPVEAERLRASKQQVADALDAYFTWQIERRQLPPFNTATYAELLNDLVSGVLQQCFTLEHGEREAFYREGVIELVERLFFGPPLVPSVQESSVPEGDTA
jgi:AcrR family transcriptional regulator